MDWWEIAMNPRLKNYLTKVSTGNENQFTINDCCLLFGSLFVVRCLFRLCWYFCVILPEIWRKLTCHKSFAFYLLFVVVIVVNEKSHFICLYYFCLKESVWSKVISTTLTLLKKRSLSMASLFTRFSMCRTSSKLEKTLRFVKQLTFVCTSSSSHSHNFMKLLNGLVTPSDMLFLK
jgi:hypothetical protein